MLFDCSYCLASVLGTSLWEVGLSSYCSKGSMKMGVRCKPEAARPHVSRVVEDF